MGGAVRVGSRRRRRRWPWHRCIRGCSPSIAHRPGPAAALSLDSGFPIHRGRFSTPRSWASRCRQQCRGRGTTPRTRPGPAPPLPVTSAARVRQKCQNAGINTTCKACANSKRPCIYGPSMPTANTGSNRRKSVADDSVSHIKSIAPIGCHLHACERSDYHRSSSTSSAPYSSCINSTSRGISNQSPAHNTATRSLTHVAIPPSHIALIVLATSS